MSLQELLEHAHLDALGQLDEREQAAFEAAFAVAPPAVKAQIRHEQARWAPMEHLLPRVDPSPELRGRVLDAVTAAMVNQGAGELSMRPSRRVAPAWRAATIGLMTAVVILGAAFVYVYQTNVQSNVTTGNDQTRESLVHAFKGNYRSAILDPRTTRTAFQSAAPKCEGAAWTNPDWTQVYVFVDLPKNTDGEVYRLVTLADDGKVDKVLDSFASNGVLQTREIGKLGPKTQLAVVIAMKDSQPADFKGILLTVTI